MLYLLQISIPLLLRLYQLLLKFGQTFTDGWTVLLPNIHLFLVAEMLFVQVILLQECLQNL